MTLPLKKSYAPMEAQPATELPSGPNWQYEPKWDGFRCVAFRDADHIDLESKSGKPLTRYFPELVAALSALKPQAIRFGRRDRHSRRRKPFLRRSAHAHSSRRKPRPQAQPGNPWRLYRLRSARGRSGESLVDEPLEARRKELEKFAKKYWKGQKGIRLSPITTRPGRRAQMVPHGCRARRNRRQAH